MLSLNFCKIATSLRNMLLGWNTMGKEKSSRMKVNKYKTIRVILPTLNSIFTIDRLLKLIVDSRWDKIDFSSQNLTNWVWFTFQSCSDCQLPRMSEAEEITVFAQVDSSGKWNVCNECRNWPLNQEEIIQYLQHSNWKCKLNEHEQK